MYLPGLIGLLVNPFWIARRALADGILSVSHTLDGRLLDVGCGSKPYETFFDVDEYVGLEIDRPETRALGFADVFYDGTRFPFPDSSFDSVLCNQVLEHVFEPEEFLSQVARVLRPGGRFVFSVPFVWDEHEQPWDYARYTTFGLRALFARHNLYITDQQRTCTRVSMLFQLFNGYVYKQISGSALWVRLLVHVLLMAPITITGLLIGRILPPHPDLYLDQVVSGVKR